MANRCIQECAMAEPTSMIMRFYLFCSSNRRSETYLPRASTNYQSYPERDLSDVLLNIGLEWWSLEDSVLPNLTDRYNSESFPLVNCYERLYYTALLLLSRPRKLYYSRSEWSLFNMLGHVSHMVCPLLAKQLASSVGHIFPPRINDGTIRGVPDGHIAAKCGTIEMTDIDC